MVKKVFIVIALFCLGACAAKGKTVGLSELFTLKRGEIANVRGTALNMKMLENGTSQRASGGDMVFCKIEVKYQGVTEEKSFEVGDFIAYGDFNIRLEKVNTAIDVSQTSCVFSVGKTLG